MAKKEDNTDGGVSRVETRHGVSLHRAGGSNSDRLELQKFQKLTSGSLSIIMNHFKGAVRTWCKQNDHGNFTWQPGFYDHIVRNSIALERINEYIRANPEYWEADRYYPENLNNR